MTQNMISWRKAQEEMQHNREMERLTGEQQAETARHDRATEAEQYRSNRENEKIKYQQNAINMVGTVFGTVLPELQGKSRSQIALNYANAKVSEQTAKVKEAEARVEEQEANLKAAQVFKTHAETAYIQRQTLLIPYQMENYTADTAYKGARAINYSADTELKQQTYKFNQWNNPARTISNWDNALTDTLTMPAKVIQQYGNAAQSVEGAINGANKIGSDYRKWKENKYILSLLQ